MKHLHVCDFVFCNFRFSRRSSIWRCLFSHSCLETPLHSFSGCRCFATFCRMLLWVSRSGGLVDFSPSKTCVGQLLFDIGPSRDYLTILFFEVWRVQTFLFDITGAADSVFELSAVLTHCLKVILSASFYVIRIKFGWQLGVKLNVYSPANVRNCDCSTANLRRS